MPDRVGDLLSYIRFVKGLLPCNLNTILSRIAASIIDNQLVSCDSFIEAAADDAFEVYLSKYIRQGHDATSLLYQFEKDVETVAPRNNKELTLVLVAFLVTITRESFFVPQSLFSNLFPPWATRVVHAFKRLKEGRVTSFLYEMEKQELPQWHRICYEHLKSKSTKVDDPCGDLVNEDHDKSICNVRMTKRPKPHFFNRETKTCWRVCLGLSSQYLVDSVTLLALIKDGSYDAEQKVLLTLFPPTKKDRECIQSKRINDKTISLIRKNSDFKSDDKNMYLVLFMTHSQMDCPEAVNYAQDVFEWWIARRVSEVINK